MTIRGIDVSSVQGVLGLGDWRSIAQSGIRFASIRCGNGNNVPDGRFRANVAAARAVGLVVQAYAVLFPLPPDGVNPHRSAKEQAASHFEQCGGTGRARGEMAPCVDLEWPTPQDWARWKVTAQSIVDAVVEYLAATESLVGRLPYVYTYPDFAKHLSAGADLSKLARYPLWAAEYGVNEPYVIPPWSGCLVWQRSGGGGRLPNGAPVDEDVFEGDEAAFALASNLPVDPTDGGNDRVVHPPIDPAAT